MTFATLGEVRMFAGTKAPTGWMFCDGSLLQIASNQALYSLLKTTYGGDGKATFAVPDLRGRIVVGTGAGSGLRPYTPGQTGGSETIAMRPDAVPKHNHPVYAASSAANSLSPDGASFGTVVPGALLYTDVNKPTISPRRQFSKDTIAPSGGSPDPEPHDNMMPCVGISFIIAIDGGFPSP